MKYTKPQMVGYSALAAIQETGLNAKKVEGLETDMVTPSDPAYQADE